jgi:hypothetical protein
MRNHDPRVTLRQLADFIDEAEVLVADWQDLPKLKAQIAGMLCDLG